MTERNWAVINNFSCVNKFLPQVDQACSETHKFIQPDQFLTRPSFDNFSFVKKNLILGHKAQKDKKDKRKMKTFFSLPTFITVVEGRTVKVIE